MGKSPALFPLPTRWQPVPTQAPAPLHPTGGEKSHLGPNPVCRAPLGHLRSWGAGVLQGEGGKDPASAPLQMDRGEDALGISNPREVRSALLQLVGGRISARNKTKLGKGECICKLLPPWGTLPAQHGPSIVLSPWGMQLTPVPSWMWAIDLLVHTGEELFLCRRGAPCPWGGIASDARGCYHH